ncbi:MAG: mechanosensitive ion channel family protein [Armatimonadetes bacterium]|nr:mechanosensitive ion channel family protein [Armatimonadota bacterium]
MNFADIISPGYWMQLWRQYGELLAFSAYRVVLILVIYFVVRLVLFKLINRMVRLPIANGASEVRKARVRALQSVTRSAVGFILGFLAGIMVLQAVGVNIVPLLTTASVAGLAIGFGAQKLVKDVISGFFILTEDQYGVGDYVTIGSPNGVSGVVEDLGMRTTRLRDTSGKLFIISNGDIVQVFNHSRGALRMWTDVTVPADEDLEGVKRVLSEVGSEIAEQIPDKVQSPFVCEGLPQISGEKTTVRLAGSVSAQFQDAVLLDLNERIKSAFEQNGLRLG